MKIENPFHKGEIEVQERAGERGEALLNGRLYEDEIMLPARKFLEAQSYFIISTVNEENGEVPLTVLVGAPGFMKVEDEGRQLRIQARHNPATDPVLSRITPASRVGGLGIELSTRRRLRINAHVLSWDGTELLLRVDESYPNCPKYIQKRVVVVPQNQEPPAFTPTFTRGDSLTPAQHGLLKKADTFFISSLNPEGHADASHRGGPQGFIEITDQGSLKIPDYKGNSLFNTFGNLRVHPQASLLVWDFENAALLHLYGHTDVLFDQKEKIEKTTGTGRWLMFTPTRWEEQRFPMPFRMDFIENSPFNPQ